MKKIFILLFLSILIFSCKTYEIFEVYHSYYGENQKGEMTVEIHNYFDTLGVNFVSFDEWLELYSFDDDSYMIQRMLPKSRDDKTDLVFIYNTFIETDTTYYEFRVRVHTEDRKLIREFNR